MKTTTVPAQVTTVEDRLAGNLSLSQLLLLVAPVFISCVIYVIFPPFLKLSLIKVGLAGLIFLFFAIMSIRIKGKIILMWTVLILKYRNRPRFYVYDKNEPYLREKSDEKISESKVVKDTLKIQEQIDETANLETSDLARLEIAIADPRSNFNFKRSKNGVLNVHITEIQ